MGRISKLILLNQDLHIGSDKSLSESLYAVLLSDHQSLSPQNRENLREIDASFMLRKKVLISRIDITLIP
ncbi:MAG: hypothetical protein L6406_17605 [Desulfobacterales bacterium]|nr:hypothetical protein [Desulfobacterales bacterium]